MSGAESRSDPSADTRRRAVLGAATLSGAIAWMLAPHVAGTPEPWDGSKPLDYLLTLALAGFICGTIERRSPWLWSLGIYAGQALVMVTQAALLDSGEIGSMPIGLLWLIPWTLPAFLGSFLGAVLIAVARPRGHGRPLDELRGPSSRMSGDTVDSLQRMARELVIAGLGRQRRSRKATRADVNVNVRRPRERGRGGARPARVASRVASPPRKPASSRAGVSVGRGRSRRGGSAGRTSS